MQSYQDTDPHAQQKQEEAHAFDQRNPEANNAASGDQKRDQFRDDGAEPRADEQQRQYSPRDRSRSPHRRSESSRRGRENQRNYSPGMSQEKRDERPQEANTEIWVGGISRSITDEHLRELFDKFGPIKDIVMKGKYAFVHFREPKDATEAVQAVDGQMFEGAQLTVQKTKSKDGGPRRYGPRREDECWRCGGRGHWSNECRERPIHRDRGGRDFRRRSGSRDRYRRSPPRYGGNRRDDRDRSDSRDAQRREGRCFLCNQRGHIKAQCPERGGRGGDRRDSYPMYDRREPRMDYGGRRDDRGDSRGHRYRSRTPERDRMRRSPPRDYGRSPPRDYGRSPPRREYGAPRDRNSPPRRAPSDEGRGGSPYGNHYM